MDNSFYLPSDTTSGIEIERFHICTWEFTNETSLVEFGCEIVNNSAINNIGVLSLSLYMPWLDSKCKVEDFYNRLKVTSNSKFIFNDSVDDTSNFDGGDNDDGMIHHFRDRESLCLLPIDINIIRKQLN
ncbi:MAG: hypothetical protein COA97_05955 [Flavobacteriales bacterium]|nr:MAG: hypothetical protein COA97_05955 [Flavobacteriales bacterium]